MRLNVVNESNPLKAVLLGTAKSIGPTPNPKDCYDPSSLKHVLAGTYPSESDMVLEISNLETVFKSYGVEVYRPEIIPDYNQIFSRDIAFVIEDKFIKSNILPERDKELLAIKSLIDQFNPDNVIELPQDCHIEGGDVILHDQYIFVGVYTGADYLNYITARTNQQAIDALKQLFPNKIIKAFELKKSNSNPLENALHLDCCFQPLGQGKALIHKAGFLNASDYNFLEQMFGKENLFQATNHEMAAMNCNVFSISEDTVISERHFTRLNQWLRAQKFHVEEVSYKEISKQGGLFRCSTMPLIRA